MKELDYKNLTEEEIDQKIIENFGQDKLDELNAISKIDSLNIKLSEYLGIEPIPVIFEDLGIEDARYYLKKDYIAINSKYVHDELELKKSLIHEMRHAYQRYSMKDNDSKMVCANDYLVCLWIEDTLKFPKLTQEEKLATTIEVDAFAFTKYILKKWFNIEYHHYDKFYDNLLDQFIKKFYD